MPSIYKDFVNQTYKLMRVNADIPIYARWQEKTIRSRKDISKYLLDYIEWDFYYEKGGKAKNRFLKDQITSMKSLVLEDKLGIKFENDWSNVRDNFIGSVEKYQCNGEVIENEFVKMEKNNILEFLFMMVCRNPNYDIFGVYKQVDDKILTLLPEEIRKENLEFQRYLIIYRMLFDSPKGAYITYLDFFKNSGEIILYKALEGSGQFITSDNPAFLYGSIPEIKNETGIIFPLTPQYLLFLGKGDPNIVRYGLADSHTINHFNNITLRNSIKYCISMPGYENVFV